MRSKKLLMLLIMILFVTTGCLKFDYSKEQKNSESFIALVEEYFRFANAKASYEIDGISHLFQKPPVNEICVLENDKWTGQGRLSSNCNKVMHDIIKNYSRVSEAQGGAKIDFPDKAKLLILNDGKIGDTSSLTYGKVTCKYNGEKFKCSGF